MKKLSALFVLFFAGAAMASPIGTSARQVIPRDIQQIIVVDYRALNSSPTALALKNRVLPDPLKQFESNLRNSGVNPDTDLDQIVFATYKTGTGLHMIGVAQGQFSGQKVVQRLKLKKVKAEAFRGTSIWPMAGGMSMTILDPTTMLFGEPSVVKKGIEVRDDSSASLNANSQVIDMMPAVEKEAVWSVLDGQGTQVMLKSALGDAAQLADYDTVRKRLLGSRYGMRFDNGVNFNLDVLTADNFTASTLSSLLKAGVLFKKATATASEKAMLESVDVSSDNSTLKMKYASDDSKFQAFLHSDLFNAVSK